LEGQEADARSDIFSFGAVLYEMITGRRPFESRTQAGVIANIMQSHPPGITAVVPQAPPALEQLARVCLAKDPAERRQTMRDVLTDLNWIGGSTSRPDTPRPAVRRRLPAWLWQAAAIAFAAATIALIAASRLRTVPTPGMIRFNIQPPAKATFGWQ
jgi:serine/threonine protein kinase